MLDLLGRLVISHANSVTNIKSVVTVLASRYPDDPVLPQVRRWVEEDASEAKDMMDTVAVMLGINAHE